MVRALSAFLFPLLLIGCAGDLSDPPSEPSDNLLVLFDFDEAQSTEWTVENDGVMGGQSEGLVSISDGTLVFTGTVVTEGGGFTSVRGEQDADLSAYAGLELRVRGIERTFEVDVYDGTQNAGREVNRRAAFPAGNVWQNVRIPFASLQPSVHGEPVRTDALDLSAIESIGVYISDGNDGPFWLEIDAISAYREAE
ncbi:MAG: CIA30 family protein [Bacteroidota bacterium]